MSPSKDDKVVVSDAQPVVYQIVEKPANSAFGSQTVTNIILALISTAIIAQAGLSVQTIKDIGIIQYQLSEIKSAQMTFLTRSEADQRGKMRDMQITNLETRLNQVERKVSK